MAENKEIVKKKDFIAIDFLGRNLLTNEIFDTNITQEASKLNEKLEGKPLIVCVGEGMVVKGFDEALEGKEIGKKYTIKLAPEKAFGQRYSNLIRMIPLKFFHSQKVNPEPGMTLALDNNLVKVINISGGRVMVDFNNPLAGKEIEYEFTITKFLSDNREKASALQRFLFGHEFEFDVEEKAKKLIFKDLKLAPILNAFKDKFKQMMGFDVEILEKKENKEEKEEKREDKQNNSQ